MTREGNAVAAERAARNLVRITEAMAAAGATPADGVKPRAAVVSWDLAHNPVGRAYVLVRLLQADWKVDLIGPMWSRFGTSLWPPLSGAQLQVRSFPATDVSDYLPKALAAALQDKYDIVLCSKSRLPGVHLATMIAEWSDAPLIVDLDDDELTFADHRTSDDFEAARSGMIGQLLDEPATKLADECLSYFDARTVVSGPLAARYGGITVRHARNPGPTPGSDRYRTTRALARARCGVLTDELAVFFIGTVREHKGVQDIVAALSEIGRDDVRLHVFTTTSDREVKSFVDQRVADADHLYVTHGPCSMDELGRIMTAADLVVLAQEPDSAISQYQVPAKISDATAVGCPVLVPKMEVFADFESAGLVHTYLPGELTTKMEALLARSPSDNDRRMLQERFLSELGMAVNRARLDEAISRARAARSAEPHHASGPLHEAVNSLYLRKRAATPDRPQPVVRVDEAPPAYDVAFFWKQNDSDIYGRRSDMVVRAARALGRVGQAVHFDGAVDSSILHYRINREPTELKAEADLLLPNVMDRVLHARDEPGLARRCFIYDGSSEPHGKPRLFGRPASDINGYADFVATELAAAGMDPSRTIAWLWPVVPGLAEVLRSVKFGAVVCDLVDDQRSWPDLTADELAYRQQSYKCAIGAADVVFTNSPTNAAAFQSFGKAITVIPNGAEPRPESIEPVELPGPRLKSPLLGYVGNMRDRVDWKLIEGIAKQRPDWQIVLVGEAPPHIEAHGVAQRCENVRLTGILPYDQARSLMTTFDVGIIPHVLSDQSTRMDPLKLYNMVAMGIPVVSTAHPTAIGMSDHVAIGHDVGSFIDRIKDALAAERPDPAAIDISDFAWSTRVKTMFSLIDGLPEALSCRSEAP